MSFKSDFQEPKDRYFAAENLNFQVGSSPTISDISGSIGIPSIDGHILCKNTAGSTGNILVEISNDGLNYGDQFTLFNTETFDLSGLSIKKIRITHSGTDSGFRLFAR